MSTALQHIPLKTIKGADASLADYAGKVVVAVNVASKCGLTPQYEGLEALYAKYKDQGLVVAGFPANDFGAQEPGTDAEIADFCTTNYGVDFPMFSKIQVTGGDKHPLYAELIKESPESIGDGTPFRTMLRERGREPTEAPEVLWNFEKFIIGRDGKVVGRFIPQTKPDDADFVAAIEAELAK